MTSRGVFRVVGQIGLTSREMTIVADGIGAALAAADAAIGREAGEAGKWHLITRVERVGECLVAGVEEDSDRLWVCDCGESAWSPVLAVDDWDGQAEPVGPDCPECGGVMECVPIEDASDAK